MTDIRGRRWPRAHWAAQLALVAMGCGGKAVVDGGTAGAGGGGGMEAPPTGSAPPASCAGMECGAPCVVIPEEPQALGQCTDEGLCLFEAICQPPDPCLQLRTCSPCEACTIDECFQGFCDAGQTCDPELRCP